MRAIGRRPQEALLRLGSRRYRQTRNNGGTGGDPSPGPAGWLWQCVGHGIDLGDEQTRQPLVRPTWRPFYSSAQSSGSGARPLECASVPLSLHSPPGTTVERTLQAHDHLDRLAVPGYVRMTRNILLT